MNISLVLKTHCTGSEVAGIQKIFSNSSRKSANSFSISLVARVPWLLHRDWRASYIIVIIILIKLCLQNACPRKFSTGRGLVSWSSMTRTFLRDNNTVFRDLAIVHGTYCVMCFSRRYLVRSRLWYSHYSVASVCLSVVVCTESIVAKRCVLEQVTSKS